MERHRLQIWPEWSDSDINSEKWDAGHAKKDKKEDKDKAKSPSHPNLFEDPEGLIFLPPTLTAVNWKRFTEVVVEPDVPVVIDSTPNPEGVSPLSSFDIYSRNEHLMQRSELMRFIIAQIDALWHMCKCRANPNDPPTELPQTTDGFICTWRPWEHIYAINKVGKGINMPQFNPTGKYCVKLFYLGSWRKITVDDLIPYDINDQPLLPRSANDRELWPMLLAKALLKIAAIDFGSHRGSEVGDFKVIHCLTGWLPESINLSNVAPDIVWSLLRTMLPEWKAPYLVETDPNAGDGTKPEGAEADTHKDEKKDKEKAAAAPKEKEKKDKDKDKTHHRDAAHHGSSPSRAISTTTHLLSRKSQHHSQLDFYHQNKSGLDEPTITSDNLQSVIFATFRYPSRAGPSNQSEASKSGSLKALGFVPELTHPICLTQTRTMPLERPSTPPTIPNWKLIRPRQALIDQRMQSEIEYTRAYQCFEVLTPFAEVPVKPVDLDKQDTAIEIDLNGHAKDENKAVEAKVNANGVGKTFAVADGAKGGNVGSRSQSAKRSGSATRTQPAASGAPPATVYYANNDSQEAAGVATLTSRRSAAGSRPQTGSSRKTTDSAKSGLQRSRSRQSLSSFDLARITMNRKWIELADLLKCFDSIEIYHRLSAFNTIQRFSDLKFATSGVGASSSKHDKRPAITQPLLGPEDLNSQYFFCDSLKPVEFLLTFSVVPRWPEATMLREDGTISKSGTSKIDHPAQATDREPHDRVASALRDAAYSNAESRMNQPHTPLETTMHTGGKQLSGLSQSLSAVERPVSAITKPHNGKLSIEPHRVKSLSNPSPILTLETTGVKSTMLRLPAGRHVLKFSMKAPLAYHLQISATSPFQFTDEESVVPLLSKESLLFIQFAQKLLQSTSAAVKAFSQARDFDVAFRELTKSFNSPDANARFRLAGSQYRAFYDAVYALVRRSVADNMTDEIAFAWRVFALDCSFPSSNNVLQMRPVSKQVVEAPVKDAKETKGKQPKKDAKDKDKDKEKTSEIPISQADESLFDGESAVPENWLNRVATAEEHEAVTCIQRHWRGHFARLVLHTRSDTQSAQRLKVIDSITKTWNAVEHLPGGAEQVAIALLRSMVRANPRLLQWLPFGPDEHNKVAFQDYNGSFTVPSDIVGTQQKFIIFREIFNVTEDNLLVPRLFCTLPSARLRLINNDTLEEETHVFSRIAPRVFQKNRLGYTFFAEGSAEEGGTGACKFRLRLLSTCPPLPTTQRTELTSNFATREIREYVFPNANHFVFHNLLMVNSQDPRTISLRIQLSKPNVYYRLRLAERVTGAAGVGSEEHTVFTLDGRTLGLHPISVPVVLLNHSMRDGPSASRRKLSVSKGSKGPLAKQQSGLNATGAPSGSAGSASAAAAAAAAASASDMAEVRPRKYVFELQILHDSWRFTNEEVAFLEAEHNRLEEKARAEALLALQAENDQNAQDAAKSSQKGGAKGGAAQKGKEKKGKDLKTGAQQPATSGSRPPSPVFDSSKPHFTLRIIAEPNTLEELELRKDNDRGLEVTAIKKAWEEAQPGRSQIAAQSRLNYLHGLLVRVANHDLPADLAEKIQIVQSQHDAAQQTLREDAERAANPDAAEVTEGAGATDEAAAAPPQPLTDEQRAELMQLADDEALRVRIDDTINQWLNQSIASDRVEDFLPPIDLGAYRKTGTAAYQLGFRRTSLDQEKEQIKVFQQLKRELEKAYVAQIDSISVMKERQIRYSEKFQYQINEAREQFGSNRDGFRAKVIDKQGGGAAPVEKVEVTTKEAKKR